jgi:hypothetical protein
MNRLRFIAFLLMERICKGFCISYSRCGRFTLVVLALRSIETHFWQVEREQEIREERSGTGERRAVSRQPYIAEPRFRAQASPCGTVFFGFSISALFHLCPIFIHVSSGGWTKGPLSARFYGNIVSSPHNSNNKERKIKARKQYVL